MMDSIKELTMRKRTILELACVFAIGVILAQSVSGRLLAGNAEIKQSTAFEAIVRLANLSNESQYLTGVNNSSVTVSCKKKGGGSINISDLSTWHEVNATTFPGVYNFTVNTSMTDTLGELLL